MNANAEKPVLVLHAVSEGRMLDRVLEHLANENEEVVLASEAFGSLPRPTAIRKLILSSSVVIAVIPNAPARGRSSVVFQVGIAVGAGVPVLLVTAGERLGPELRDLPRLHPEALQSLSMTLRSIRASYRYGEAFSETDEVRVVSRMAALPKADSYAIGEPGRIHKGSMQPPEAVLRNLATALRRGGARVQFSTEDDPQAPDMVIWHDGLQASLGLPLPVEIVRSAKLLIKIRRRLATTLKKSGGRSLLVVTSEPSKPDIQHLDEGLLLCVGVEDLQSRLELFSVPEALASIFRDAR